MKHAMPSLHLAKCALDDGKTAVARVQDGRVYPARVTPPVSTLSDILESPDPFSLAQELTSGAEGSLPLGDVRLLAPIDRQEVWAAGVTYRRSKTARMEESDSAASLYDRVYEAKRPELFFKATPHRVAGPGEPVQIRSDATWNVPEPELALVVSSRLRLVGFTVGNDMSSRDIEGENPLYLPQAKVYDACCGLGPWITLFDATPQEPFAISLAILRGGAVVFSGQTDTGQIVRSFEELIGWLGHSNSFPDGAILLTGTGIVPDRDFTLQPADTVEIEIAGIGRLSNPVKRSAAR